MQNKLEEITFLVFVIVLLVSPIWLVVVSTLNFCTLSSITQNPITLSSTGLGNFLKLWNSLLQFFNLIGSDLTSISILGMETSNSVISLHFSDCLVSGCVLHLNLALLFHNFIQCFFSLLELSLKPFCLNIVFLPLILVKNQISFLKTDVKLSKNLALKTWKIYE